MLKQRNGVKAAVLLTFLCLHPFGRALKTELLQRLLHDEPNRQLQELGQVSDTAGALQRTFLSPAHRQAALKIQGIMEDAGLETEIDLVANVHGRVRGANPDLPAVVSGSHYDTVKDAGKYDGMLGILVPIAALKTLLVQKAVEQGKVQEDVLLQEDGPISLPHHIDVHEIAELLDSPAEIVAFCDEEGIRFQTTFLGSRAISGSLAATPVLDAKDADGISVRQAISLGRSLVTDEEISSLALSPDKVKAYVEVHMEQGPVLEAQKLPLGLVTGIAGQTRHYVTISGVQGHAGTIPMIMRKDPMPAAAELIAFLEKICGGGHYSHQTVEIDQGNNLMCTVGSIFVWPNAFNVVPGSANFTLDIRSRNDKVWQRVVKRISNSVTDICERRELTCEMLHKNSVNAVYSDEGLLAELSSAVLQSQKVLAKILPQKSSCSSERLESEQCNTDLQQGHKVPRLISGAGHDALAMSKLTKMAMLFVRCAGGHSHSPLEYVAPDDVTAATAAMLHFFESELTETSPHDEL